MSTLAPDTTEPIEDEAKVASLAAAEQTEGEIAQSDQRQAIEKAARLMFANRQQKLYAHADHFLAYILIGDFVVCATVSIVCSPYAWGSLGLEQQAHVHEYIATVAGSILVGLILYLGFLHPARALNRPATGLDRLYSHLLIAQFAVCAAVWIVCSPYDWSGPARLIFDAIILGGMITSLPLYMAIRCPGKTLTRHCIAIGHMLIGVLFIHLCHGRTECHFYLFGALAALAYYRDWRVLITASLVIVVDNIVGGIVCPQSIFGAQAVEPVRWLEHAWWVAFEDGFLIRYIWLSQREMHQLSRKHSELEAHNAMIERKVELRTRELAEANAKLKDMTTNLSRSNTELQQFAYVAAHDLKEPLRTVMSYTEIIAEDLEDKLTPDMQENMTFVLDAVKRMQQLINDLLAYSRVQTQGRPFEVVDLNKTLDRALADLRFNIEEKNATVTRDSLPTVSADANQMSQLFNNLIGNALKFNRADEAIKIHIGAEKNDPGLWCMSIQDNGIGLDMQHSERIFRMFSRLHAIGEYSGTGIGLAICKRIIERHGGEIWVESERNKGSTFKFSLPELAEEATKAGTDADGTSALHEARAKAANKEDA